MLAQNGKALKEWASVLQAMETGEQIVLFRKGGIIEQHDQFEVESPEFFLFPTYIHQTVEQLQTAYQPWIAQTEAQRPGPKEVEIRLYATVEKVLSAKGIERFQNLTDAFIWTPEYVQKSWSWKPEKPAYILLLRVYRLQTPVCISERPEYGGCVSWIDLETPLSVNNLAPVLDQPTFDAKCQHIMAQLENTVVPV